MPNSPEKSERKWKLPEEQCRKEEGGSFTGTAVQRCNTQDENEAAPISRFCMYPRGMLNLSDTLQTLVSFSKE